MPPYSKQETDYYCGPAVVQMLLGHVGIIFTQEQLAKELGTIPLVGTTADAIVALLTLHGMTAKRHNNASVADIRTTLHSGDFAIIGYIEEGGDPHYALATAVSDTTITLSDPWFGENHTLPLAEFEERWRDNEASMYGNRLLITVS